MRHGTIRRGEHHALAGRSCDDLAGAHVQLDDLLNKFEETVAYHQTIGNKFLIVPWIGEDRHGSKEKWLKTVGEINSVAEKLAPMGLRTGYHNHTFEFLPLPDTDELGWDIFFGNAREDVIMQFDTGNALGAGAQALDFLKKYPGRATTVHLKEHSADGSAMLGEGEVPLAEVLEVAQSVGGTQWFIIEHEKYPVPPLECIERDLRNLQKLL